MSDYINPKVVYPDEPINIDAKILYIQRVLAGNIPWLAVSFGRSWKHWSKGKDNKPYAFPVVYNGKGGYYDCFPNALINSQCFFSHRDKAVPQTDSRETGNYAPNTWNEWRHPVDIIFWLNQEKTHPGIDYPVTEKALADVRKELRKVSFYTVTGIYYDPENIFAGYNLKYVENQYISHPYCGFRIEGYIQFLEEDGFGLCT